MPRPDRNLFHRIILLPAAVISGCITVYQHTLSPDHGPLRHLYPSGYCRHSPTCSQYMKKNVQERGAVIGVLLGIKRILSCNPWHTPSDQRIAEAIHKQL